MGNHECATISKGSAAHRTVPSLHGNFVGKIRVHILKLTCAALIVCSSSPLKEGDWKWDPGPQPRAVKHLEPLLYLWQEPKVII